MFFRRSSLYPFTNLLYLFLYDLSLINNASHSLRIGASSSTSKLLPPLRKFASSRTLLSRLRCSGKALTVPIPSQQSARAKSSSSSTAKKLRLSQPPNPINIPATGPGPSLSEIKRELNKSHSRYLQKNKSLLAHFLSDLYLAVRREVSGSQVSGAHRINDRKLYLNIARIMGLVSYKRVTELGERCLVEEECGVVFREDYDSGYEPGSESSEFNTSTTTTKSLSPTVTKSESSKLRESECGRDSSYSIHMIRDLLYKNFQKSGPTSLVILKASFQPSETDSIAESESAESSIIDENFPVIRIMDLETGRNFEFELDGNDISEGYYDPVVTVKWTKTWRKSCGVACNLQESE